MIGNESIVAEDVFVIEKHDNNGNVKMQYKPSSRAAASITKFNFGDDESDEKQFGYLMVVYITIMALL